MAEGFSDHFSATAADYRRYRPRYPDSLFDTVCGGLARREVAWDCASGSGQAVAGLAARFRTVIASDASAAQLARLPPAAGVHRLVARAAQAPLATASVDLLSVAQALHWFAGEAFYAEARRVVRPGGRIAAWTYGLCRVTAAVDALIDTFYRDIVGPWWPPERRWVEAAYAGLPWPFAATRRYSDRMVTTWTPAHLLAYLGTWSAVAACRRAGGGDPVADIAPALRAAWGGHGRREVRWPLTILVAANA
ncbi:MAG: class I SAM-dependent methyltransferase [Gammaproteobacteria bacterium]|nr:class I SAM-dependent methyltransferase [Gammaproteobacteria bacterium]MCP5198699.1 class I SAM-dependent methyltransferase [Gammaproteobacteria bacterium]